MEAVTPIRTEVSEPEASAEATAETPDTEASDRPSLSAAPEPIVAVSDTHLRAHETNDLISDSGFCL